MIEINNIAKNYSLTSVDKKFFSTVAKIVLKGENRITQTLSLAFVDKAEIQKLNKEFRKKDKPTDVLSFNIDEKKYLGEIVICPEVVKEKNENIVWVFVHGILHLCGYDHPDYVEDPRQSRDEKLEALGKIMEQKQEKYLGQLE
jgi:probable rRNA maturation factor